MEKAKQKFLISQNSRLMAEWDWETNAFHGLDPEKVACASHRKVWWICPKCRMHYPAQVNNRFYRKSGCPYCSGRIATPGKNDLETWCKANGRMDLLDEWDHEQNNGLLPSEVLYTSNKQAAWRCSNCHRQWLQQIELRTLRNFGCKMCRITGTSFPEQFLFLFLDSVIGNAKNRYADLGFELDIYLKGLNIGIEYNGAYFHSSPERSDSDIQKRKLCSRMGIPLLQITGHNDSSTVFSLENNLCTWKYSKSKAAILLLAEGVLSWVNEVTAGNFSASGVDIDLLYGKAIQSSHGMRPEKSLAYNRPEIAAEWDYEQNADILPEHVSVGTHDKYFWVCKTCGYRWAAKVNDRTSNGSGCPICGKKKQIESWHQNRVRKENFRDWCLSHNKNLLLLEWDYPGNHGRPPESYSAGSSEKVSWKCRSCGHIWPAALSNRKRGSGCPKCWSVRQIEQFKKDRPVLGSNSLISWCRRQQRDDLLVQWDYEKNEYPPDNYTYGSNSRVFWKCTLGHTWQVSIKARTICGNSCPLCRRKKVGG